MSTIKPKIKTRYKVTRTNSKKKLTSGSRHHSKLLALAVISIIACVGAYITFDASAASKRSGTIFFEGDSITALYSNDPTSKGSSLYNTPKVAGYQAYLTDRIGKSLKADLKAVSNAQGGSGFVKRGTLNPHERNEKKCGGTTFEARLTSSVKTQMKKAKAVVIEGGRNDGNKCDNKNNIVDASAEEVTRAVNSYFDKILQVRGGDPKGVYVITPWGMQRNEAGRKRIVPIVQQAAEKHGFTFVRTENALDPKREFQTTFDGVHPNKQGAQLLADIILNKSNIKQVVAKNLKN